MADSQTNININIDTSQALANLKALQSQISAFQTQMARGSATQAAAASKLRQNLINDINAAGKFNASIQNIKTTTESFTEALEKNKLSMGQYFKYAGGATKNFGKLFKSEMSTIDKVARERVKTLQTQYIQLGRDASGAMKAIAVRPLVLDMDDLGTKTAIAAQKQQILNQLLKQGSTNLLNWGKNTQWAGRQLMVGFTVPLTMAGTAAAKMYMELEKASIKFKRVYGDFNTTAKETEKMIKDIQFLAQEYTKYGVAVSETMEMAAEAAAAGKVGADLMEQVANATRLAVLGSVEQSQALETTMSLTNAFGLAAEDLAGKINFLNAVENQTVTSIEDLTIAIPKAAPVIKQLGGNVEDLAFFLTAMKEGGINASEGANALKSGIASMINPTGKANEFLQSFGINLKGIVESNKGDIKGTIIEFAQALDTLDPLNRARAIEQLFGKFQFARMSTLFQNVVKEGTQAQKVLELSRSTTEELAILSERELKRVESSPMFKFQKAVEDVKVRLAPIGESFLKAITPIIDFVGKFLDGFNKMSDGAKSFWITFTGLVAGVGPLLLMTVGLIGNGVANLIKMFVGIKSFINRTTQETGFLGESTSYMTETQIRAAAVAASLDQVHQQLTQRFTSEAAAVDALTAAYARNITAQSAYGPMGASPTTVGKKYADGGIISGPGTGTSDSIVAMVSNGEAIIPAKSVARNPQLVQALIAGNVPGLELGGINYRGDIVKGKYRPIASSMESISSVSTDLNDQLEQLLQNSETSITHARKIFSMAADASARGMEELQALVTEVENLTSQGLSGEKLKKQLRQNLGVNLNNQGNAFAHIGSGANISRETAIQREASGQLRLSNSQLQEILALPAGASVAMKHGLGLGNFDQSANAKLAGRGLSVEEFGTAFDNAGLEKWNDSIKFGGGNIEELSADVSILDAKFKELIAAIPAGTQMFDTRAQALEYMSANPGKVAKGVDEVYAQARGTISGSGLAGVLDTAAQTPTEIRLPGKVQSKGSASRRAMGTTMPEFQTMPVQDGTDDAKEYLGARDSVLDQPDNDPYNPTRQRNSPNPLAAPDGKDDATAYLNARNETLKSSPLAPPPPPGGIPGVDAPFAAPVQSTMKDKIGGVASKIKGKGLDLVADGLKKGKEKLITVADGLAQSWSDSIDRQIEADRRIHAQRVQVAEQLLLATDDEYLALQTQQDIYKQKLLNTNQATEAEIAEAVQREQIMQSKRATLVEEMKENGTESAVIQERARLAKERGNTIDLEQANNTNQASGNQKGKLGTFASKASGIMMTASMVSGALTMAGGKVGELAGAITPVIGGLSMLTMLLQQMSLKMGLATIAIAGIALVIYGFMQFKDAIGRGIDSVLDFNDAIGSGAKAIQGLADFAGKVSASEIMDKRRQSQLNPFQVVSGKTTFGENFVESETGQSTIKSAGANTAAFGAGATKSALFSELATAVMSNAITPQQARSIAISMGKKMGNINLGIKLAGELSSLLGPNGENIIEDGLSIRVKLIEESQKQVGMASTNLQQNGGRTGGEFGNAVGGTALGLAGGAVAGGIAGGALAGSLATAATVAVIPGAGWIIGGAIALTAIAGAAYGYFQGSTAYAERLGKLAGANVAIQSNALNQQKQMLDSLQLDYEKRIETAKAAGDTAKAEQLQNQYILDRQALLDQNVKTMAQIEASFKNSSYQDELLSGVEKSINKKYKDTAMEDIAGAALSNLQTNVGDKTQRYQLEMLLNTTVDPMSMLFLTDLMATDSSMINKAINIGTNLTGTGLNDVLAISSMFVDENGKPNTTLQTEFITKMSVVKGKEGEQLLELYGELGRMNDNWLDATVLVDFVSKNPTVEKDLMEDIDAIKGLSQKKLSVDIVQNARFLDDNGKDGATAMQVLKDNVEFFDNIKTKGQQQIYLSYVATLSSQVNITDKNFLAWVASPDNKEGAKADILGWMKYTHWVAQRAAESQRLTDNLFTSDAPKTTGGSGPSASWLDDYVKGVRDLTDASQKLTIGYDASSKALQAFAKKGAGFKNTFAGLATNLYSAGISQDIIDNILGMPKEEADKYMKLFFDKNGKITNFVKQMNQISAIAKLRQAEESGLKATKSIYDRVDATKALVLGNKNSALSSEMLADADMVVALAGVKLIGNQKEQKKQIDMLTKSKLASLAADRLSKGAVQNEIDDAQVRIDTLEAQNNVYQNGLDIISKRAEKINEAYDKQIQALQEVKSVNDEIMKQKQGELDVADALSRGDIGAAAKAAQQLRAQQAQAAADAQIKALEDAKKRAVDTLTVEINGQKFTRVDLEQKMYDISLQVLEIKKDEIVQNEVILAKQKEILNSLIAQTAEQIKKNAEASKPISQTITRKVVNAGSGNGSGSGSGKDDPAKDDPAKDSSGKPVSVASAVSSLSNDRLGRSTMTNLYGFTRNREQNFGTASQRFGQATTERNRLYREAGLGLNIPAQDQAGWSRLTAAQKEEILGAEKRLANATAERDKYASVESANQAATGMLGGMSADIQSAVNTLKNNAVQWVALKAATKQAETNLNDYKKKVGASPTKAEQDSLRKYNDAYQKAVGDQSKYASQFITPLQNSLASSGIGTQELKAFGVQGYAMGGMVMPKYFSLGNLARGTDTVPAMLTPGEFIVSQPAVKKFGVDNLKSINSGTYGGDSVYNYSVNVNVSNAGANANDIAQTVMSQIRQIDAQRIRSNNL